jgi:hypothetical protein
MTRLSDTTTGPIAATEESGPSAPTSITPEQVPDTARWQGRAFGGIILAAFLLYGIGSATADQPVGLALVVANSIAVASAGLIGFRLVRSGGRTVGIGYLAARVAEAILLAGGILLAKFDDFGGADNTGYLLGMAVLSVGSIPFFTTLRRRRLIPQSLATWGVYAYAALAAGTAAELVTGRSLAFIFAVPGGLFELALGFYLVCYGFRRPTGHDRPRNTNASWRSGNTRSHRLTEHRGAVHAKGALPQNAESFLGTAALDRDVRGLTASAASGQGVQVNGRATPVHRRGGRRHVGRVESAGSSAPVRRKE